MNMATGVQSGAFDASVNNWIADRLAAGYGTFADLLSHLPGVYPTEVLAGVRRLAAQDRIERGAAARLEHQARMTGLQRPRSSPVLPHPHPLDFEWRFTPATSRWLLDSANEIAAAHEAVLLFGTPGVALEALSHCRRSPTAFLGESNSVTRRLEELNREAGWPLSMSRCGTRHWSRGEASAVILDPPWYLDFIRPMLAAAASACREGGHLLVSLPPPGARPSAGEDRAKVLRFAERIGLAVAEVVDCALTYETPFFEANALAAAGLQVPVSWRRGDLVIFRKVRDHGRPVITHSVRKEWWREVELGTMRLFVRQGSPLRSGDRPLIPLVQGDVLPTVSRRDPRRRKAEVWTSGNRVFASNRPDLVTAAALALSGTHDHAGLPGPGPSVMIGEALEQLGSMLREIASIEDAEACSGMPKGLDSWSPVLASSSRSYWTGSPTAASG